MSEYSIPFNKPYMTGRELKHIAEAHENGRLAGDGPFTQLCHQWLEERGNCHKALLTHSCTAALEMSALLLNIEPGDEIIMPSYTFVSTANAFVLRGGVPVFVDIREDTLNLNEDLIEAAISSKTIAIVAVHYAGVACEMDKIMAIAKRHRLKVVEDAAQGMMASYKGKALGSIGELGVFSFHETKNIISGEGGALLINEPSLTSRAEIIREKGTDRGSFFRGEVDKYTWCEQGSSFLPGELIAAFLWAQLEEANQITQSRLKLWQYYHDSLEDAESKGIIRRPVIPDGCVHNAHMYYVLLSPEIERNELLLDFKRNDIQAVFHYVPLHSSPAGSHYGKVSGKLSQTESLSERIVRLPLWLGMSESQQEKVVELLSNS
ncbi:dTDP-4-amino-4,6-dideoxygalactose transaminase [Aliikangiella coralliicola]|uniref:dTDP-4-amino-4,6-dideoxygalactose transaminase n=1 Tax=Aliikangiella coralliicola TaxID=2592383 RepID=A0A545TSV2_9GAMM|nr:dTDP-4-amino-4,6-dideoxygalactose transaminase [Aliikangiella coralliicola]TQV80221.1 dTDP-4-amino-4,6-dideoxygalactose transaminase [Aliikangiella coralliicola]